MSGLEAPHVSVVVSARNVASTIALTLDAVLEGLRHAHLAGEVVVVDDASADGTSDLVRQRAVDAVDVRLLRRAVRGGPNASRNAGALASRGTVLIFVDGDDRPSRAWAGLLVDAISDPSVIAGGAYVADTPDASRMPTGDDPPAAFGYAFALGGAMAMTRAMFDRVDGFDANIMRGGTEVEFCIRAQALFGARIVLAPGAVVLHREERSPVASLRASYQRQRGMRYVQQSLARQGVPIPGPVVEPRRLAQRWAGARSYGWATEAALVLGRNGGRLAPPLAPRVTPSGRSGLSGAPA